MDHNSFISGLARQSGKDIAEAEFLTKCLTTALKDSASALDSVAIPGFGRFDTVKHDEYITTDTTTGRSTLFPPEIKLTFTAGAKLKKRFSNE